MKIQFGLKYFLILKWAVPYLADPFWVHILTNVYLTNI